MKAETLLSIRIEMVRTYIVSLFLLFCTTLLSQNQTNHWYFGNNASLNFNNGTLNVINDSQMSTPAGCSTISDDLGNLLFYTNGQTVWNRNHEVMVNGNDLPGEITNTQTSIIIPKPNDVNTYYIISTRINPSTSAPLIPPGVFISQVEFTPQNPLGIVTIKRQRILSDSSERVTASYDPDSNTYKVIVFANITSAGNAVGRFYIFTISETGFTLSPVISDQFATLSKNGAIKVSPDGKFVALADHDGQLVYVYEFNSANNTLNYFKRIPVFLPFINVHPYGVEFSPDSKIVYFTGKFYPSLSFLFKYILVDNRPQTLPEKMQIAYTDAYSFGSLQLATDGNIYVANFEESNGNITPLPFLGAIKDPESTDPNSGFEATAVNLGSATSTKGLPNFVSSFFRSRIIADNNCLNEVFDFSLDSYGTIQSVVWDFGDGNSSTLLQPSHQYANSGSYTVKATITVNNTQIYLNKFIEVYPIPELLPNQTLYQCDVDNDNISVFNLQNIENKITNARVSNIAFYNSLNEANGNTNPIVNPNAYENTSNPEQIFARIYTEEGCSVVSSFFIESKQANLTPMAPFYSCENSDDLLNNNKGIFDLNAIGETIKNYQNLAGTSVLTYYHNYLDAQTKLNPIHPNFLSGSTKIWVRVDNNGIECQGLGEIELVLNSNIQFSIDEIYTFCEAANNSAFLLDGGMTYDGWEWRDQNNTLISNNREHEFTQTGTYSLTVFKEENNLLCAATKTFEITQSERPEFNTIETNNTQIFVSVAGESDYEFSLDNIHYYGNGSSFTFTNVLPGIHTIYVKDRYNCEKTINTEISYIGYPKHFSPNGDGYIDSWNVLGVNKNLYSYVYIEIYDRYGKVLYTMDLEKNNQGWDGTYNGQKMASSDYWFKATLTDRNGKTYNKIGHFSLIN